MKTILRGLCAIIIGGISLFNETFSFLNNEYISQWLNTALTDDSNISVLEKQDWQACKNNRRIEKCDYYLKHYPNGYYVVDARKRKQEIEDAIRAEIDEKIKEENAK